MLETLDKIGIYDNETTKTQAKLHKEFSDQQSLIKTQKLEINFVKRNITWIPGPGNILFAVRIGRGDPSAGTQWGLLQSETLKGQS